MNLRWPIHGSADDAMNPIVVKELRQAVRSRFVAGILLLLLLIQLVGMGIVLLTTSTMSIANMSAALRAGRSMFHFLMIVLSSTCILFVPAYVGIRLAMERWDDKLDLLFITTIRPSSVIRGKLLAGTVTTVLLFSSSLPFMSFTYLLRGVDLPSVFVVLALVFLVVVVAIQVAMFLAALPASRPFKILLGLVGLVGLTVLLVFINTVAWGMIDQGVGSQLRSWQFWGPALMVVGTMSSGVGIFFVLSVALISPKSANRALPIRIFVTLLWLAWGGVAFVAAWVKSDPDIVIAWFVFAMLVLALALLVIVGEEETLSTRVRRAVPRRRALRRLAFLFYSGPAGGLVWVVLLAASTVFITLLAYANMSHGYGGQTTETLEVFTGVFLYAFAYAMTGILIQRLFLKRRLPASARWVVALLVMAAVSILPVLLALLSNRFSWDSRSLDAWYYYGNLFVLGEEETRAAHICFAAVWACVSTLANMRWLRRQVRAFESVEIVEGVQGVEDVESLKSFKALKSGGAGIAGEDDGASTAM